MLSSVFLCLALGFCLIGSIQSQKLSGLVQSQVVKETARKVRCASIVCVIFFTCRCIAWAWEPLTGCVYFGAKDLDIIIYPWFYFTVPESVNVVSILYLLKPSNTVSRRARGGTVGQMHVATFFPSLAVVVEIATGALTAHQMGASSLKHEGKETKCCSRQFEVHVALFLSAALLPLAMLIPRTGCMMHFFFFF